MSVHAMAWAFDQTCAPSAKLVLLSLADHADEHGRCYPSLRRLILRTGLARDTLCRQLAALEAGGWIVRERGAAVRRTSTVYTLKQSDHRTSPTIVPVRPSDPKQSDHRTEVVRPSDHNRKEPKQEPKQRATRATAWPDGWTLTDDLRDMARTIGANAEVEWPQFADYHAAKGSTFKDWPAAWRTWCRNSLKFAARSGRFPASSVSPARPSLQSALHLAAYVEPEEIPHA